MTENDPKPPVDLDAQLEAEIASALGDMSVEDMFGDAPAPAQRSARGGGQRGSERQRKTGTVVSVHKGMVYVEFGPKSQGMCPVMQFKDGPPTPGEQLPFMVDRFDRAEGLLILSREGEVQKAEWESLDVGQVVEARCTGTNKGGLDMEVANHRAFMPASHVDLRHIDDLNVFVGEKFPCEVIELDHSKARIVLSRRLPLEAERAHLREDLLEKLEVGQTVTAVVTSIQAYGAFADIGGVDGLIHISDLSHQRITHPSEVVKDGEQLTVKVLKIEQESAKGGPRIALGLKQTLADPFHEEVGKLEPGGTVSGRVTRVADFGAFVEITPGVEGLIHISELSHERVNRVSSVVKPDEIVTVKVLSIDPDQRRISLSLKALKASDADDASRGEDPQMRKLRAQLSEKFGDSLKGGLG